MKRTFYTCLLAMFASLLVPYTALVPKAGAASSIDGQLSTKAGTTITITVTPTDGNGVANGPTSTYVSPTTSHTCTKDVACKSNMLTASYYTGGSPSAYGCKTVNAYMTSHTVLGSVAYRWHNVMHWCWINPYVGGAIALPQLTDTNGYEYYRGVGPNGNHGYYYNWNGYANSGYYAYLTGKMENCVPIWGCVNMEYPWVWVRGHSNGTFSWDWGY